MQVLPGFCKFESVLVSARSYRSYTAAMKTVISIPDPLFEKAEELAHRLRVSRSELYANALRAFVGEHDEDAKRRVLDELYATESSALPAGARGAQARIVSEWEE
jgi:metal-responsive CopG/Arc/MetJ family transcriptional regulator